MTDKKTPPPIAELKARTAEEELARLNRVTGLKFDSMPDSLIREFGGKVLSEDDTEELVARAMTLWSSSEDKSSEH